MKNLTFGNDGLSWAHICVQEFDSLHMEAEIQRDTNSLQSGTGQP